MAATISVPQGTAENVSKQKPASPSDKLQGGESTQKVNPTAGSSKKNLPNVVRNPMEVFSSNAVLWTMACLKPEQFNNPPSYRNSPADLTNIVFSSGGRFDAARQKIFISPSVSTQAPEYYINNFLMKKA